MVLSIRHTAYGIWYNIFVHGMVHMYVRSIDYTCAGACDTFDDDHCIPEACTPKVKLAETLQP